MNIDDMKSTWKQVQPKPNTRDELLVLTKINSHPKLRRIRLRLLVETVGLICFLLVFNDAFDAVDKPLWTNVALIVAAGLFIWVDFLGFLSLKSIVKDDNMLKSLSLFLKKLRNLRLASILASLTFGTSLILFFGSNITYNSDKYLILTGIVLTLVGAVYISYLFWSRRIQHLQVVVNELNA